MCEQVKISDFQMRFECTSDPQAIFIPSNSDMFLRLSNYVWEFLPSFESLMSSVWIKCFKGFFYQVQTVREKHINLRTPSNLSSENVPLLTL